VIALADIRAVSGAVYRVAQVTPCLHSHALSEDFGAAVYLKAECLQRTGSFKVRGAAARISRLSAEELARGVVTASAGNHAQGVAIAARQAGIAATVVMPVNAALAKVQATRAYGATVLLHGDDFAEASAEAARLARDHGLTMVPAFDDEAVIAGQGTVGLEIAEQCPQAALALVPVGGGGLISGVAVALKSLRPGIRIVGVQAAAAPAALHAFRSGRARPFHPRPTLADGVAVSQPGRLTLPLMRRYVDDIVTVEEEAVAQAIVLLLERTKLVTEGAGALGVAALISGAVRAGPEPVVVLLSGGNIDINVLSSIVQHGLQHAGRYLLLTVELEDRPGTLAGLLRLVADAGANVLEVSHIRQGVHLPVRGVEVRLLLETRDQTHIDEIESALLAAGYVQTTLQPGARAYRPAGWG
jgi:threonine dehydratase